MSKEGKRDGTASMYGLTNLALSSIVEICSFLYTNTAVLFLRESQMSQHLSYAENIKNNIQNINNTIIVFELDE